MTSTSRSLRLHRSSKSSSVRADSGDRSRGAIGGGPWFERPDSRPSEVEQRPAPAVTASTPASATTPEPAPALASPRPAADPIVVYRPLSAGQPEQVVREVSAVEFEQTASLVERLRSSLGDPQELADPSGLDPERRAESSIEESSPSTGRGCIRAFRTGRVGPGDRSARQHRRCRRGVPALERPRYSSGRTREFQA